jgi:hypothetical protein
MAMIRKTVVSSHLAKVAYDKKTEELEITFRNGRVYLYYEVPKDTFDELINAESKGRYFNHNIRDDYQYTREA